MLAAQHNRNFIGIKICCTPQLGEESFPKTLSFKKNHVPSAVGRLFKRSSFVSMKVLFSERFVKGVPPCWGTYELGSMGKFLSMAYQKPLKRCTAFLRSLGGFFRPTPGAKQSSVCKNPKALWCTCNFLRQGAKMKMQTKMQIYFP